MVMTVCPPRSVHTAPSPAALPRRMTYAPACSVAGCLGMLCSFCTSPASPSFFATAPRPALGRQNSKTTFSGTPSVLYDEELEPQRAGLQVVRDVVRDVVISADVLLQQQRKEELDE